VFLSGVPAGVRVTDHISFGVIAKTFPPHLAQIALRFRWVQQVLADLGTAVGVAGDPVAAGGALRPDRAGFYEIRVMPLPPGPVGATLKSAVA